MVSYIADEFLRADVNKIKAGEKVSGIEEYFIPRHVLWFLDACGFRIQGRHDQESTTQGVKRITKNMKLDADPKSWDTIKKEIVNTHLHFFQKNAQKNLEINFGSV